MVPCQDVASFQVEDEVPCQGGVPCRDEPFPDEDAASFRGEVPCQDEASFRDEDGVPCQDAASFQDGDAASFQDEACLTAEQVQRKRKAG